MIKYLHIGIMMVWRNRRGGGAGGRVPPETSDREFFADVSGKKETRKKGKRGEN